MKSFLTYKFFDGGLKGDKNGLRVDKNGQWVV